MIPIAIALVIIACITGFLVNRWLDLQKTELDRKYQVNIEAINTAAIESLNDQIHKFDERINSTWGSISSIKQELEAYKLSMGLRNRQ